MIAGSYTPFCLISIGGWLGWTLFSLVWLIAIVGIVYKSLTLHKQETVKNISTIIYIVLGWLCIIAARPLYESLGFTGTALLVAGVSYIRCSLLFIEKCAVYACGLAFVRHACSDPHVFFCSLLYVISTIRTRCSKHRVLYCPKSLYYKGLFFFSNYFNIN